ncbi:MAG TPA: PQQ-binding-like beta-propeller repeat protein [Pirellulales bacterium]|nr:PQQ-binding-like beta-propeller repeat protein [Pirellulales bacterium]
MFAYSVAMILACGATPAAAPADLAREVLEQSGVRGGFVVHLGCGDGKLTAALRATDSYQVHGLDTSAARIAETRAALQAAGVYGPVSVDRFDGKSLPYIDGMVNLVVAENLGDVPQAEVERVLCPRGVACIRENGGWKKIVKPVPPEIDDWTHYFHDAGGNPVAHDTEVAPPERLQWVGSPRWSRHHDRMSSLSALVSSRGRMYYILDEGSRISIELPSDWQLIARDAFNGTILWKQPIEKWHDQMWPLKSGPTQLARRLVADGDDLYLTLGIRAPVSHLDGATGKTKRVFEGTKSTEELLLDHGTLFLLVNRGAAELDEFAPKLNTGDQGRVATEFVWNEKPRDVMAFDAATGKRLWSHRSKVAPLTLCANEKRVIFHDGDKIVCLDPKNGKPLWSTEPASRRKSIQFNFGPRLVLHEPFVLYAGGEGKMRAYDAADGKMRWESEHAPSGYQSPQDIIIAGGMVWVAPTTSGRDSGIYKGRDLLTGEVKIEFPPDIDTYWFHHRCYIAKATDRFIIPSRTGIELVDFKAKHWDINHWVRGACLYGVLPCNGLLYAPPHNCACYPEAKLYGINALAAAPKTPILPEVIPEEGRLELGKAFGEPLKEQAAAANEWPTFRHDNQRSGYSAAELGGDFSHNWETEIPGRLSAIVVAGGLVYVAQIDQHTLHALDAKTGKSRWTYTAGGRIDSPPTYWNGRLFFGSMDGWVYSLRASDGALLWRYRAAPLDRRLMAFEQLESVWPVHGSIMIEKDVAHFVVGRSSFLDGGMWYVRLDPRTGKKLGQTVLNDRDPETGEDIQNRLQTLQMPVALADILCTDGECVYLRSQKFDDAGQRQEIGPVSGDAAKQGGTQAGPGRHLFAPMGFLDDTWFHRAYWVYGKNFAGGHNGYFQAGKHTPSGRILVFNDKEIYGYARQPQYYRWTTPLEHQLFSANRDAVAPAPMANERRNGPETVEFAVTPSIDPTNKPLTVEAWVKPDGPGGVIVAHGGPAQGYALFLQNRKPTFAIRSGDNLTEIQTPDRLKNGWHHLAGVLTREKDMRLYVDGVLAASGKTPTLISSEPKQKLELGGDTGEVGSYKNGFPFVGSIDEVRITHRALTAAEVATSFQAPEEARAMKADVVVHCTFDDGNAKDDSGKNNDGDLGKLPTGKGRIGTAVVFPKAAGPAAVAAGDGKQLGFDHNWTKFVPVFARAMVLGKDALIVSGPPDLLDEEYALERLAAKDPAIQEQLQAQADSLEGKKGGRFTVVSTTDGSALADLDLDALPVWDGMSTAYGRIYMATTDGRILCLGYGE